MATYYLLLITHYSLLASDYLLQGFRDGPLLSLLRQWLRLQLPGVQLRVGEEKGEGPIITLTYDLLLATYYLLPATDCGILAIRYLLLILPQDDEEHQQEVPNVVEDPGDHPHHHAPRLTRAEEMYQLKV